MFGWPAGRESLQQVPPVNILMHQWLGGDARAAGMYTKEFARAVTRHMRRRSRAPAEPTTWRVWPRHLATSWRRSSCLQPTSHRGAAGHVPEMVMATHRDAFGLRGRLTACMPQPRFQRLSGVTEACAQLFVRSRAPEDFLAALPY